MRELRNTAITLLFFLTLASTAIAETINMFAGVPMGGFGDVACNLFMAQQLKRLRPELEIRFLVNRKQLKHVQRLLPGFDASLPQQQIGGLQVYTGAENTLPRADIFLGYALKKSTGAPDGYAKDVILPDQMTEQPNFYEILRNVSNSPIVFHFSEFYGSKYDVTGGHQNGVGGYLTYWQTGPTAAGVYILPHVPTDIPSRAQTEQMLAKELGIDPASLQGRKLALGYSTYQTASFQHLEVLKGYAAAKPNEQFTLVTRGFPELASVKLPPNLNLIPYTGISFDLTRALVAHSEAPNLVTGDTSMSLAIDFRKPFLYEQHWWKTKSAKAFLREMERLAPYFAKDAEGGKAMKEILTLSGDSVSGSKHRNLTELGRLMASPEFQTNYDRAVTQFKVERSLPAKVLTAIDAFKGTDRAARLKYNDVHGKLAAVGILTQPPLYRRAWNGCWRAFDQIAGFFK